jgi:hypothetical protein
MRRRHRTSPPAAQRGVTLLVGMIMLVLITVLVLASYHLGRNNLEIVGNAQQRAEGLGAAQQTIEAAFSSPLLTSSPGAIFPTPCTGFGNNTLCYDVNGDAKDDVVVQITPPPKCVKAQPIPTTSLNLLDPNDRQCTVGISQQCFGVGGQCGVSNCANTVWDIRAVAQNLDVTGTAPADPGPTAVVNQGISVRVGTNEVATSCP